MMEIEKQPDVANPSFDGYGLREDLERNEFRLREALDHFVADSVTSMDAIRASLTEGRKEVTLQEIDTLCESAMSIHAATLASILVQLRKAIQDSEESVAIEALFAQSQTAYQGTIELVKRFFGDFNG